MSENPWLVGPFILVAELLWVLALVRFGLVALTSGIFVFGILERFPITTQVSAWYAWTGFTGLFLLAALALYGFYTSQAGRPLFGAPPLGE